MKAMTTAAMQSIAGGVQTVGLMTWGPGGPRYYEFAIKERTCSPGIALC